jgi:predicted ribosomally synthesized peptide with nif11-like leader
MSEEQLKAFLNALEADTGLQAKIEAAVEGEIDTPDETAAVLAIAKEAGFGITAADLLRFEAQNILELSDEELERVAGGFDFWKAADVIVKNDKLYKKLDFAYKLFNGKLF